MSQHTSLIHGGQDPLAKGFKAPLYEAAAHRKPTLQQSRYPGYDEASVHLETRRESPSASQINQKFPAARPHLALMASTQELLTTARLDGTDATNHHQLHRYPRRQLEHEANTLNEIQDVEGTHLDIHSASQNFWEQELTPTRQSWGWQWIGRTSQGTTSDEDPQIIERMALAATSNISESGGRVFSGNVVGVVDRTFEPIVHPRGFFKKGRVFMTLWVEPQGYTDADSTADGSTCVRAFTEMTRFAVIRAKSSHCLCLKISTYNGKGTKKPGVIASDHAVVVPAGKPIFQALGEESVKGYLPVKVEAERVVISPMSRMNFAKVYTIEHNVRVRNVGRIDNSSMASFENFFLSSFDIRK